MSVVLPAAASVPEVRVRIVQGGHTFLIRALDGVWTAQGVTPQVIQNQKDREELELRCLGLTRGIELRSKGKDARVLLRSQARVIQVQSPAGFVSWNGKRARGELRFVQTESGCDVVNRLELEKYVDGLINSEFRAEWEEHAVAAQAIAARTYAYYQMKTRARNREFDLESTVADQVYEGAEKEDFRASRAVARTAGVVLVTGAEAQPIKAYYHSTCGGQTTLPERVWGKSEPGFRHTVRCTTCGDSPRFKWSAPLSAQEIAQKLSRARLISAGSQIEDIWVVKTDETGRASRIGVRLVGRLNPVTLEANVFRLAIGGERVKSTAFSISRSSPSARSPASAAQFQLIGRGFGHGVGMCQWGTRRLAREGRSFQAILKQYYPGARLAQLSY